MNTVYEYRISFFVYKALYPSIPHYMSPTRVKYKRDIISKSKITIHQKKAKHAWAYSNNRLLCSFYGTSTIAKYLLELFD